MNERLTINPNGILIRKCCASCSFKRLTRIERRWCKLQDKYVNNTDGCDHWVMSEQVKLWNF